MTATDGALGYAGRSYPAWPVWHGHVTGSCWAAPPPSHPHAGLVCADDADALAAALAAIERTASHGA